MYALLQRFSRRGMNRQSLGNDASDESFRYGQEVRGSRRLSGITTVGHPSTLPREMIDNQSYPLNRQKALPDSVVAAVTKPGEEKGQSDELAGGPECDFQLPTRCDWIIERVVLSGGLPLLRRVVRSAEPADMRRHLDWWTSSVGEVPSRDFFGSQGFA